MGRKFGAEAVTWIGLLMRERRFALAIGALPMLVNGANRR
jgi:hypothetical protein